MACLSLNDQAFIFITMTFPSFITTGGTVDIPTVPLERKSLDLTPLIQQLMMNKKTPATSSTAKNDEKDPDIKATTGQAEQWYDLYNKNNREMQGLINWYGADLATSKPEYRQLVNEKSQLEAVRKRLENNKEDLDAYDAHIKEKEASGLIHLDMLARTGQAMSYSDWGNRMNYAQIDTELRVTNPHLFRWEENFSWTPKIKTKTDALTELRKKFDGIGTSAWVNGGGGSQTFREVTDDMVYLVNEHNTWLNQNKSNNNIYNENPTGVGQLEYAKQQALKSVLGGGLLANLESNDMKNGFVQDFFSQTSATVSASSIGVPGGGKVKTIFKQKVFDVVAEGRPNQYDEKYTGKDGKFLEADYKKDYEEWDKKNQEANKTYNATHDGYYWKEGQKDENDKDIGGYLDEAALTGDFNKYIEDILNDEVGKRLTTETAGKQDLTRTTTATDTWQNDYNLQKEAEVAVQGANSNSFSIAVEGDYGITEKDLMNAMSDYNPNNDLFDTPVVFNAVLSGSTEDDVKDLTYNEVSPFIVSEDPKSGARTYKANPNFTDEAITNYEKVLVQKYRQAGSNEADARAKAEESVKKAKKAHKVVTDANLAKGVTGQVVFDGTKSEITTSDPETWSYIKDNWMVLTGADGRKVGKEATSLLSNQLIQVGLTVEEGTNFLGPMLFKDIDEGYSLSNFGLASNAGARIEVDNVTIKGKNYRKGDFIHSSVFDQLGKEDTQKMIDGGYVNFGPSGFWDTRTMTPDKPNKTGNVTGMGPVSGEIYTSLHASGSSNLAESPTSITATTTWARDKSTITKYWIDNKTTLFREKPAFTHDKDKAKLYDEAEKVANYYVVDKNDALLNQMDKSRMKPSLDKVAKELRISEGTEAYKILQNAIAIPNDYQRKLKITEAVAKRDNIQGFVNWDMTKKAVREEIMDGQNVKPWAKQQMYYNEKVIDGVSVVEVTTATEIQSQMRIANSKKYRNVTTANDKIRYSNQSGGKKAINVNPIIKP